MAEFSSDAARWHERYDIAAAHQEPMFKKFAAWYDIAATVYPKDRKPAAWRSKVLFPTLGNKAWQLAAKFIGLKPGWRVQATLPDVTGMDDEQIKELLQSLKEQEEKAQRKLDYDYDCPEMEDSMRYKLLAVMMDAIIPGTGLGKAPWTTKTKEHYERVIGDDGVPDMTQEKVTTKTIGYNDFIPCDIFNVFKSPTGGNLYGSPWIIIVEHKTLAQLEAVNEANGGTFYEHLNDLEDVKSKPDKFATYKAARNRLVKNDDTIELDTTIDQFPVYECYDLDKKTISWYVDSGQSTGDSKESWVEIRSTKNFYWHGKFPLVAFYIKRKPHEFWGQGIFEIHERVDAGKNDIFNHYMDEWNVSASGGIIAEENTIINDYVIEPGFEITYKSGKPPEQWKFPEPNPAQLTTLSNMLDRVIEDGTISAYAAGTPNSATDTTAGTKGGIQSLQQAADDILSFGRSNFRESITQVGKFFLSNNRQFMSEPMTIRDSGDKLMTISPADLQGELNLEVTEDSMQDLTKDQQLQQNAQLTNGLTGLATASANQFKLTGIGKPIIIDYEALAEELGRQYNVPGGIGRFMVSEEEVQKQMEEQAAEQERMAAEQAAQAKADAAASETGDADAETARMGAHLASTGRIPADTELPGVDAPAEETQSLVGAR